MHALVVEIVDDPLSRRPAADQDSHGRQHGDEDAPDRKLHAAQHAANNVGTITTRARNGDRIGLRQSCCTLLAPFEK